VFHGTFVFDPIALQRQTPWCLGIMTTLQMGFKAVSDWYIGLCLSTLVLRTLPIQYELRQYQPYTSTNLVETVIPAQYQFYRSINAKYIPASYRPRISLGPNIRTRLVWKFYESVRYQNWPALENKKKA
jgi:hypothetical protein